ncbi:MAG: DUF3422 family protein [Hyphomicrobiales bacterium]|nr:DUF3422 family protein [Hyphomicrobiales bacterium]MDE2114172.1 DUF3422 domain-containing protein [Hyphomicrobiales bacterium]
MGGFTFHPERAFVMREMHSRPFTLIPSPRRILHYAFMPQSEARVNDRRAVRALCEARGLPGPPSGAKYHRADFGSFILRWEGHSEFTTYTFEINADPGEAPFSPPPQSFANLMAMVPPPGPLLVMVDLHLYDAPLDAPPPAQFNGREVAVSHVENQNATIISDFHEGVAGFVAIAVQNHALNPAQCGALVQRLLEIETYRTLALLGLPEAQALAPKIRQIELELPQIIDEMRVGRSIEGNRSLLDRLTILAAELEHGASSTAFRFGATKAYSQLIRLRLNAMDEQPVAGLTSWRSVFTRRFEPAVRTCAATQTRADDLAARLAHAAQLLRTRVQIDLETQNSELLHKMNDRAKLQLRLQQTVEGLSVAAITYYVSSLAERLFEGLHAAGAKVDPLIDTALSVPLIFLLITAVVWRIRARHKGE